MTQDHPEDDALEGNLSTVTDEEWRQAHETLADLGIPQDELSYVWAPGTPASEATQ